MTHPNKPLLNILAVPASPSMNRRLKGFYAELGFASSLLDESGQGGIRGIRVSPEGFDHLDESNLSYWVMDASYRSWVLRGSNSQGVRSRWHQGIGRPDVSKEPDALIALPSNEAVRQVFRKGGELLVAHSLSSVQTEPDGRASFDYVDPLFNRVTVAAMRHTR